RYVNCPCPAPIFFFFFSSRRRHTRCYRDWSSDVCSSDLEVWHPRRVVPLVPPAAWPPATPASPRRGCHTSRRGSAPPSGSLRPRSEERRVGKECGSR